MECQFNYLGCRESYERELLVWGIYTRMGLTWTILRHNETFGGVLNTPLIGFRKFPKFPILEICITKLLKQLTFV